jgi:hypothetical protein
MLRKRCPSGSHVSRSQKGSKKYRRCYKNGEYSDFRIRSAVARVRQRQASRQASHESSRHASRQASRERKALLAEMRRIQLIQEGIARAGPESPIEPVEDEQVIGSGGYGCVIWPAIVFWNSDVVTQANRKKYVTKVASDATSEYDLAKAIQAKVPSDVGIFPVDQLICGLTYREIKKIADSYAGSYACGERFMYTSKDRDLWVDKVQHRKSHGSRNNADKVDYVPNIARHLRGGTSICAIQYPKYDSDLNNTIVPQSMKDELQAKLRTMHQNLVVHLDIKGPNLAQIGAHAYFADWGFARILSSKSEVDRVAHKLDDYKDYYGRLVGGQRLANDYIKIAINRNLTLDVRIAAIMELDKACLTFCLA